MSPHKCKKNNFKTTNKNTALRTTFTVDHCYYVLNLNPMMGIIVYEKPF